MSTKKLWGGRFSEEADPWVNEFGASISFDQLMAKEDILGSLAHVKMIKKTGILNNEDADKIIKGLEEISDEYDAGTLVFDIENEDIHMNIESILTEKIGPVAGKLHTGRSRNDQVATDFHLYLKNRLPIIIEELYNLQKTLIKLAEENIETIMPGYTHLQHAQPISYGHYLMAYYSMFKRDIDRFEFNMKHTDISPLGAAALAGTTFPIDREFSAKELGFNELYSNSLDAVSDRDFALEFLSNASILMMHLSRFCEEISMWVSFEFQYIELSDQFTTGSSIMPQKKNPDMAELIRGKSGRVYGNLLGLLSTMKSLPLAYNKDLQEDKEGVFDTVKTIIPSLKVFNGMISSIKINKNRMYAATENDYSNATELADYLSSKGIPFREAHAIVGKLVLECIQRNINIQDLSITEFKNISNLIEDDIYEILKPEIAVQRRNSLGGTSFEQIKKQIQQAKKDIQ
ncbi:argininosuccinate lyase [Lactobacillus terrae]|uniref:argininosuccinate lyase n=1 Tax=Lactobacillus terrae TaxID=2269374 RepID=UPI000C1B6BD9|nr:argininosuccinate lyase [Lactobacillus terrae]